jgi:hypothetical protein
MMAMRCDKASPFRFRAGVLTLPGSGMILNDVREGMHGNRARSRANFLLIGRLNYRSWPFQFIGQGPKGARLDPDSWQPATAGRFLPQAAAHRAGARDADSAGDAPAVRAGGSLIPARAAARAGEAVPPSHAAAGSALNRRLAAKRAQTISRKTPGATSRAS